MNRPPMASFTPTNGPCVVGSKSVFYPGTEHVMGWEIGSQGLKVQLSSGVPELVFGPLRPHIHGDKSA